MRPAARRLAGAIALSLALAPAARGAEKPDGKIGSPAPPLALVDLDGAKLDLASLRGKIVVIDFWATWCAPCRAQVPQFVSLQKKYREQGVEVVGISLDDSAASVRAFREKYGMTYRVALGDAKLAERWGGIYGLPAAFVIDRLGTVRAKHEGEGDVPEIEKVVAQLVKER